MDLTGAIKSAENQYKQILEDYFITVYKKNLPSHGLEHHRRVWNTAKELLLTIAEKEIITDIELPSQLIIACYLHDAGMASDHGPEHGRHSAALCLDFLEIHDLNQSSFPDLLRAIVEHDNKNYETPSGFNLLTLLSAADDLDAFGFIGIYRYIEIYAARGIKPEILGNIIRENASVRFKHFEVLFRDYEELVSRHRKRFKVLNVFFNGYDEQLTSCTKNGGYLKIVEMLSAMAMNGHDLDELIFKNENSSDKIISWFFNGVKAEL